MGDLVFQVTKFKLHVAFFLCFFTSATHLGIPMMNWHRHMLEQGVIDELVFPVIVALYVLMDRGLECKNCTEQHFG